MIPLVLALILISTALAALVLAVRATRPRGADAHDDDSGHGGGGGNVRPPTRPWEPCGEGDPAWWPEFEREFEAYAAERSLR